ncbi:MgtC/SapB family protein [Citricoccus muralis]|uniref:MgtC/SapB family protein n=1 Tax=Citricoccus muralis TaxID=169134 RepID=A0ABY8H6Q2_9MICC|nr:MgtC/SapB family protein [Citricoccus muralis]WFP16696.1 MgtC/SapB family protein [Citricoccus muralis]
MLWLELGPSCIAAQIVTGIGFLGAGVIFVRKNIVSGLTTAASIWVTAAVGMACGAGMPLISGLTVLLYLLAVTVISPLIRRLPHQDKTRLLTVRYTDRHGALRDILRVASEEGYEAVLSQTTREKSDNGSYAVEASMRFTRQQGTAGETLLTRLSELDDVLEVRAVDEDHD